MAKYILYVGFFFFMTIFSIVMGKNEQNAIQVDLHHAVDAGQIDVVKKLIAAGVDINTVRYCTPPLYVASRNGYAEIVNILLKAGADVNWTGQCVKKKSSLHIASRSGYIDVVKILIENGADVNARDYYSASPLYGAASEGYTEIVKCLIEAGANVNQEYYQPELPISLANYYGHIDVVKILIEAGSHTPRSLLIDASRHGHVDLVKLWISLGYDINTTDYAYGKTALHYAFQKGHKEIIKILIESGADINAVSEGGETFLLSASEQNDVDLIKVLIDAGQDINKADHQGFTPVHIAIYKGHTELVKFLIEAGADLDFADNAGRTPLLIAAADNNLEIVKILLAGGADINKKDMRRGTTALHIASVNGYKWLAKLLIEAGADVNVSDREGITPLHLASTFGHASTLQNRIGTNIDLETVCKAKGNREDYIAIAKMLIAAGADINEATIRGFTSLSLVGACGNKDIEEALTEGGGIKIESPWKDLFIAKETIDNSLFRTLHGGKIKILPTEVVTELDRINNRGLTPLHIFSSKGNKDLVKELINLGVDVNKLSRDGFAALHYAIVYGRRDIAKELIVAGADVGIVDKKFGFSVLHLVILDEIRKVLGSTTGKLEKYQPQLLSYFLANCSYCENQNLARFVDDMKVDLNIPAHSNTLSYIVKIIKDARATTLYRERQSNIEPRNWAEKYPTSFLKDIGTECNYCKGLNLWKSIGDEEIRTVRAETEHSLLQLAALTGQIKTVKLLLSKIDPAHLYSYINSADTYGRTALHFASQVGSIDVASLLIKNGADVNINNVKSTNDVIKGLGTPLHVASRYGHVDVVRLLINSGANVNTSFYGYTPLHESSKAGDAEVASTLLGAGAEIDLVDATGNTPLHIAARLGHVDVVKLLINSDADINAMARVFPGSTYITDLSPVYMASAGGHTEVVRLLIDAGAILPDSARFSGLEGEELVEELVHFGLASLVEYRIDSGLDVNKADSLGFTPLHMGCEQGYIEVVKLLMKAGANIDAVAKNGDTVLIAASRQEDHEIVKILVEAGADVDKKNNFHRSPIEVAASYGNTEVVEYLLQNSARVSYQFSHYVHDVAFAEGYKDIVKLVDKFEKKRKRTPSDDNHVVTLSSIPQLDYANATCIDSEYSPSYLPFLSKKCKDWLEPIYKTYIDNDCSFYFTHSPGGVIPRDILLEQCAMAKEYTQEQFPDIALLRSNPFLLRLDPSLRIECLINMGYDPQTAATLFNVGIPSDYYERCDLYEEYFQVKLFEKALLSSDPFHRLKCLIDMGYDPQIALIFVCSIGDSSASRSFEDNIDNFVSIIKFLIELGADINKVGSYYHYPNERTTPLIEALKRFAFKHDAKEYIKVLLEYGADPNLPNDKGTPLFHIRGRDCATAIVPLLIEYGADVNATDHTGQTLLLRAPLYGALSDDYTLELLQILLEAGADINHADNKGNTILHVLLYQGKHSAKIELLKYLISMGVDVDKANAEGITPLHIVFSQKYDDVIYENSGYERPWRPSRMEILKVLIDAGADINLVVKDGVTPFHISFKDGSIDFIKSLIDLGVDVNKATKLGITPLHMFTRLGNVEAVKVLLAAGADVMKVDNRGLTPLDMAREERHDEIVSLLSVN